jgi:hypothetical protein
MRPRVEQMVSSERLDALVEQARKLEAVIGQHQAKLKAALEAAAVLREEIHQERRERDLATRRGRVGQPESRQR